MGLKNISGCDISEKAIELAQEKGIYSDLKVCDIRKLPYKDNSFNSILSNCALEHVEEINIALSEVGRVLAKGGYLMMTMPSKLLLDGFPPKKFFKSIGMDKFGEKLLYEFNRAQAHRNIFDSTQWEKLLNEAGLKILHQLYLFDRSGYKIAMLWDRLLTLCAFKVANRFFGLISPCWLRKTIWRSLLKTYYLESTPLENGGELVIIAEK